MILGKGQSSWSAALAELLIIALGVLVALGADAWNAGPLAESATYEDLRSSGKLGLIRDPALRMSIINYYRRAEGEDRRIIARRTQYPHIAYRTIPQSGELLEGQFGGVELVAAENRASVVAAVRASELSDHIIAETNRALFIHGVVTSLRGQALTLLRVISDYLVATR